MWWDDIKSRASERGSGVRMPVYLRDRWSKLLPQFVAGSDEVGYGCLAGPLVVCAVAAELGWEIPGLQDSKTLSFSKMEAVAADLYAENTKGNIRISQVEVGAQRIDELGVMVALRKCHAGVHVAAEAGFKNLVHIIDGMMDVPGDNVSVIKADTFIPTVMAASILAKYTRDCYMRDMAELYPGYGFETNVGYGTKEHLAALKKLGPCALHRRTYSPVSEITYEREHAAADPVGPNNADPT